MPTKSRRNLIAETMQKKNSIKSLNLKAFSDSCFNVILQGSAIWFYILILVISSSQLLGELLVQIVWKSKRNLKLEYTRA